MHQRYLKKSIEAICFQNNKMAFVSGPRQCGKTTLAKQLLKERTNGAYFNWDEIKFRRMWAQDPSSICDQVKSTPKPLIILDELHKAKLWKKNLKGVFDTQGDQQDILVTGSARLNVYRKGSDSLLGRYYHFRLHPFSVAELSKSSQDHSPENLVNIVLNQSLKPSRRIQETLQLLDKFGPFPEPFLSGQTKIWNLWQRSRIEKIIREDLRDLSRLPELSQVEMLASLLPEKVAGPLSIKSLSEDLEVSYTTIKRWLSYLQELYYFFTIRPYSQNIGQSLKKEQKSYLWDWSEVKDEPSRFENMIASHLLKYCHFLSDTGEGHFELFYLKTRSHKEIDFLITKDKTPWLPVEVKTSQTTPSPNWKTFLMHLPCSLGLQVIQKPGVFEQHSLGHKTVLVLSSEYFLPHLI